VGVRSTHGIGCSRHGHDVRACGRYINGNICGVNGRCSSASEGLCALPPWRSCCLAGPTALRWRRPSLPHGAGAAAAHAPGRVASQRGPALPSQLAHWLVSSLIRGIPCHCAPTLVCSIQQLEQLQQSQQHSVPQHVLSLAHSSLALLPSLSSSTSVAWPALGPQLSLQRLRRPDSCPVWPLGAG